MKSILTGAMLGLALLGGALISGTPAAAAERVTIASGPVIAFGYSDGYWDRDHRWHKWRNASEMRRWRETNREHYFARRHDRERDHGWRDHDRWWDQRR
jgi:hypothetical protein